MAMRLPCKHIHVSLSHHHDHHVNPCRTYTYVVFRTNSQSLANVEGRSRRDSSKDGPLCRYTLGFAELCSHESDQGV